MLHRLINNWVYSRDLAGVLLLLLAPILVSDWPLVLIATFLHLPAYMLHQLEEHDDDRFRHFVNATIGKGRDVLSPTAVFIINVPGVWGVAALSLYLATKVNCGFALIVVYLVVVNAVFHIVPAVILRIYNPGLVSAVLLFIPLGAGSLWLVQQAGGGTLAYHALGLLAAVAIHAAILVHVRRQVLLPKIEQQG